MKNLRNPKNQLHNVNSNKINFFIKSTHICMYNKKPLHNIKKNPVDAHQSQRPYQVKILVHILIKYIVLCT